MKRLPVLLITLSILFVFSAYASAAPIFNDTTGHWYDTVTGDWYTAEANALTLGGHLVTINDANEQEWLNSNFDSSTLYWIGFNDFNIEGNWVWVSGELATYTNWVPGSEPNGYTRENAAIMNWGSPGKWNDWWCLTCSSVGIAEWVPATSSSVPEPGTLALVGSGLAGLTIWRKGLRQKWAEHDNAA